MGMCCILISSRHFRLVDDTGGSPTLTNLSIDNFKLCKILDELIGGGGDLTLHGCDGSVKQVQFTYLQSRNRLNIDDGGH